MIIDGHAHAAGVFYEKDSLVAELDRLGVDKIVLAPMGVRQDPAYSKENMDTVFANTNINNVEQKINEFVSGLSNIIYDAPNKYLFSLKQQCPERIIQYYWANPNDPHVMEYLEKYVHLWNFSGVKLHQMVADFKTDQESIHQIAEFCEAHDMPLFIHLFKQKNVFRFMDVCTEHQHTRFIVGHMIGYDILQEHALGLDNFWFDISPSWLVPKKILNKALAYYGADRLMLGSDTPLGSNKNLEKNLKRVRALAISDSDKDKILGLNLQALLNL